MMASRPRRRLIAFLFPPLLLLAGCDRGPQPIRYGQDECAACKMTLVNRHYGAEFISGRGKVYKFDDLNCLLAHARRTTPADPRAKSVVVDFTNPNNFLPVADAWFLHHPGLRTPMGSGLAAFASQDELEAARSQLGPGGRVLRWAAVGELLK